MLDKLRDEAERLLDGHAADEGDHVRVVALSDLLHGVNLVQEVSPLTSCGTAWRKRTKGSLLATLLFVISL